MFQILEHIPVKPDPKLKSGLILPVAEASANACGIRIPDPVGWLIEMNVQVPWHRTLGH